MNKQANIEINKKFAEAYLRLRQKEGRVYTDGEVAGLPFISSSHPLKKEWKIRARSAQKLVRYFSRRKGHLKILELGCGNGWLSHRLSLIGQCTVLGMDVNLEELEQARRVFPESSCLQFAAGGIEDLDSTLQFDCIVLASSIQYFSSFPAIIDSCLERLSVGGEIHILDSHFYKPAHLEAARRRSAQYFICQGAGGMKEHYFHHSVTVLNGYHYRLLHDPSSLLNKYFNPHPFHWICIQA